MQFLVGFLFVSLYSYVNTNSLQKPDFGATITSIFNNVVYKHDSTLDILNQTSLSLKANFSDYVDKTCLLMQNNEKLSIIKLPNRTSEFFLFNNYYSNGELEGLRRVSRNGDCFVNYEVKLLLMVSKFHFDELKVTYDLLVKFLFIHMNFKVSLILNNADIETGVLVDADKFLFTMDRLVIPQVRTLRITVKGEGLIGWIIDKISVVITYIFKRPIILHIEDIVTDAIQYVFDNLPFYKKTDPIHVSPYCFDRVIMPIDIH